MTHTDKDPEFIKAKVGDDVSIDWDQIVKIISMVAMLEIQMPTPSFRF